MSSLVRRLRWRYRLTRSKLLALAADRIEELEARLEREREIYHRQRDTMDALEDTIKQVRLFVESELSPQGKVAEIMTALKQESDDDR